MVIEFLYSSKILTTQYTYKRYQSLHMIERETGFENIYIKGTVEWECFVGGTHPHHLEPFRTIYERKTPPNLV